MSMPLYSSSVGSRARQSQRGLHVPDDTGARCRSAALDSTGGPRVPGLRFARGLVGSRPVHTRAILARASPATQDLNAPCAKHGSAATPVQSTALHSLCRRAALCSTPAPNRYPPLTSTAAHAQAQSPAACHFDHLGVWLQSPRRSCGWVSVQTTRHKSRSPWRHTPRDWAHGAMWSHTTRTAAWLLLCASQSEAESQGRRFPPWHRELTRAPRAAPPALVHQLRCAGVHIPTALQSSAWDARSLRTC